MFFCSSSCNKTNLYPYTPPPNLGTKKGRYIALPLQVIRLYFLSKIQSADYQLSRYQRLL